MLPQLTEVEARVLGSLIEKSFLTPDQYPLSLNALVNACNQKTSREPVMELSEEAVTGSIATLFEKGLAVQQDGSRVAKFVHAAEKVAGPSRYELSVLAMLLLRGPQTAAELRVRTERMCEWADNAAVEKTLADLMERPDGPLVAKQARGRWAHLLSGAPAASAAPAPAPAPGRVEALEARVAALEERLAALEKR